MTNPPFTTGALTTLPNIPNLDMNAGIGQRSYSFRFALSNGVTGEQLGDIHPIRNASLNHDTSRVIKRQLSLNLGVEDIALIDPLTARVSVYMVMSDGTEYSLGKYLFTDASFQQFTSGDLANVVLNDEMFLVDQQINQGINGANRGLVEVIKEVLADLPVTYRITLLDENEQHSTVFTSTQSWTIGSSRGQILDALALAGDFFSPWFDNQGEMRFIRAFNPANRIPDFDFDNGHSVYLASVMRSSEVLTAPNRFVVVSNNSETTNIPIVATATVPVTAPNSFANRGFYITQVFDLQLADISQAVAVASNLAQRQTIFEKVNLTTTADPRHDSYNVIKWQNSLWLELSWQMQLTAGGTMTHVLRKGYVE